MHLRTHTGFAFAIALALLTGPSCTLLVSTSGLADGPSATDASVDGKGVNDATAPGDARSQDASAGVEFFDSFDRPDSSKIGNGWIEKDPTLFVLEQGAAKQVVSRSTDLGLTVFRPAEENAADVEVRSDFISYEDGNYTPWPRLVARLDPSLAAGSVRAYIAIVYVYDQELRIMRGDRSVETTLATTHLSSDFSAVRRYRLALRVTGASPVTLVASVVDTTSGREIANIATTDDSEQRIQGAGSMGFAGDNDVLGLTYDNFAYTRW
jgi:hypothetical protein